MQAGETGLEKHYVAKSPLEYAVDRVVRYVEKWDLTITSYVGEMIENYNRPISARDVRNDRKLQ